MIIPPVDHEKGKLEVEPQRRQVYGEDCRRQSRHSLKALSVGLEIIGRKRRTKERILPRQPLHVRFGEISVEPPAHYKVLIKFVRSRNAELFKLSDRWCVGLCTGSIQRISILSFDHSPPAHHLSRSYECAEQLRPPLDDVDTEKGAPGVPNEDNVV